MEGSDARGCMDGIALPDQSYGHYVPLDPRRLEQVLSSLAIFISVATLRQVGRISIARLSEIRQDRHR
jgi:hypothetical protein